MKTNLIVNKSDNLIIVAVNGFEVDEDFLDSFYHGQEYAPQENTTTEYFSMVEAQEDLLEKISNGILFKYVDGEIIEVKQIIQNTEERNFIDKMTIKRAKGDSIKSTEKERLEELLNKFE